MAAGGRVRPLLDWFEARHLELMAEAGFDDVRRAHDVVFVHLPAEGRRLTELADAGEMSKQAMGELVDDLVAKAYLERVPDPTHGRANPDRVGRARGAGPRRHAGGLRDRGGGARRETIGRERFEALRAELMQLVGAVLGGGGPPA